VLLSVGDALQREGYEVDRVSNILDLPFKLLRQRPDIVLLDLDMPGMSGLSWGAFLRKYDSHGAAIVIHSSLCMTELESAAETLKAEGIIPKGASPAAMRAILVGVLRRRAKGLSA
jgi:DNA-binding response OmpR family regulator